MTLRCDAARQRMLEARPQGCHKGDNPRRSSSQLHGTAGSGMVDSGGTSLPVVMKVPRPQTANDRPVFLRKTLWKNIWFSLLRSRRDKRARKTVLAIGLFVIWALVELWIVFVLPRYEGQRGFQLVFNVLIAVSGFAVSRVIRRSNQRENNLLNLSITGRDFRPRAEVSLQVRDYLADRAIINASLLA